MTMKPVLHSFAYGLDFLRDQVGDVASDDMVAQPIGIANHPAWVIGHLTFVCQTLGGVIGIPEWLPKDWGKRYGTGSIPVANRNLYEPKYDSLSTLKDAQSRMMQAVENLNDSQLDQPFPDESYHYVFPTIRYALTQVLVGHTGYHVGQLPIWRKAMGLPRIGRSYE